MTRTGLAYLRDDLRGLCEAGTAEWTLGTITYFSDEQLDIILDKHAEAFTYQGMEAEDAQRQTDGTYKWSVYEVEDAEYIEQSTGGTAVFVIQDNLGAVLPAASYTMDYRRGYMTLVTPVSIATPYYATGTAYDINGAAADIWQMKANHVANSFDFSTDNHSINRSQVYKQFMAQAAYYRSMSAEASGGSGDMKRKDTDK